MSQYDETQPGIIRVVSIYYLMWALLLEFSKQWNQRRSLTVLPLRVHEAIAARIDSRAVNTKQR